MRYTGLDPYSESNQSITCQVERPSSDNPSGILVGLVTIQ